MAFMDMLPVLFFSVSVGVLASRFDNTLFLVGAIMVIVAGGLKVTWKFIMAIAERNMRPLNMQMRYVMPAGFIVMAAALIIDRTKWSVTEIISLVLSIPAVFFFVSGAAGVGCMIYFARHFNGMDAKANWIEQGINSLAQLCIMLGILVS